MSLPLTLGATLIGFSVLLGATGSAPFRAPLPDTSRLLAGPAMKNANLSPSACKARLLAEKAPVAFLRSAAGVATPTRILGPLGGITYQTAPASLPYGIVDCRLVLTLLDAAPLLRAHDVKSVRIDNFYRKGAKLPSRRKKSQHAYALAADVVSVTLSDGTLLDVEKDFHGHIGDPVCGPEAKLDSRDPRSLELRNLACDLGRSGLFHHILTPNHDRAHKNHLHLDIARDNQWFCVE
jgi:hypothetical protein